MELRTRNVAHGWYDKQVIRWFRKSFNKQHSKNLKIVYLALTEIDSDFREKPISSLHKTIQTYCSASEKTTYPIMLFFDLLGIAKVIQLKEGTKFGKSTLHMYEWNGQDEVYTNNKEFFDQVLSGKINRSDTRTRGKSCTREVVYIKNDKSSISKNDKSSIIVSNETRTSDKVPRPIAKKIVKKVKSDLPDMVIDPHKANHPPKAKYEYTKADHQLYNALVNLGATPHREQLFKPTGQVLPSKSYFKTMNKIHELLNDEHKPPFSSSRSVPADYKIKDWSAEDVLDTFEYYLKIAEGKKFYKNAGDFIYSNTYGTRSWSPLVKFHHDRERDNGTTLSGDANILLKFLRKEGYDETEVQASMIEKTIRFIYIYCKGYRISQQLAHIYHSNIMYAFNEHVQEKMNSVDFKPQYMVSEKFVKRFVNEAKKKRILVKGINNAIN